MKKYFGQTRERARLFFSLGILTAALFFSACQIEGDTQPGLLPESLESVLETMSLEASPAPYGGTETQLTAVWQDGLDAPFFLAGSQAGDAILAWSDVDGHSHLEGLDLNKGVSSREKLFEIENRVAVTGRYEPDAGRLILVTKSEPYAGSWTLVRNLYLEGWSVAGERLFETTIVATDDYETVGNQGYYDGGARLASDGTGYAVFFGSLRRWPDGVTHEGDYLQYFDKNGEKLEGGWSWGTSHSFRQRFIHDGENYVMATIGDAYPRGLVYSVIGQTDDKLALEASQPDESLYQYVPYSLGDLAKTSDGSAVVFDSLEDRESYDIAWMSAGRDGVRSEVKYIIEGDGRHERIPRMATYGDGYYLVSWAWYENTGQELNAHFYPVLEESGFEAMLVDEKGRPALGTEDLDIRWRGRTEFTSLNDGSVVWVSDTKEAGKLTIYRFMAP